jgi:Acyl-CoA reductase (LuxC)
MITNQERIGLLLRWGAAIEADLAGHIDKYIYLSTAANVWFTIENCRNAIKQIVDHLLDPKALTVWVAQYPIPDSSQKTIALIPAGNLPLVGFHDVLCVFAAGHKALIKQSEKDQYLLPALLEVLFELDERARDYFIFQERLAGFDAVIATGSNNTSRYFEAYFGKYPHIIRSNRHSVAVLTGNETDAELALLAEDVFRYFGLGCRSVSHVFLPMGYDPGHLGPIFERYADLKTHHAYLNNYEYNRSLLLLSQTEHYDFGFCLLIEDETIASRIATLHYSYYNDPEEITLKLLDKADQIQCTVSHANWAGVLPLGSSQQPTLSDYPDGVDVMAFLCGLGLGTLQK